jgi:hypothetical protein
MGLSEMTQSDREETNMDRISAFAGQDLEWLQPKALERRYELQAGPAQLAALTFKSAWGTLATAETADGTWTFKRVGFLNPRVTVRAAGSPDDLAVYQPKFWGDGTVTFADGVAFRWQPANFWATEWTFSWAGDVRIVRFKSGVDKAKLSDLFKTQAMVELEPDEWIQPFVPLLTALGMYLIVLHQHDAAGVVAATAAT